MVVSSADQQHATADFSAGQMYDWDTQRSRGSGVRLWEQSPFLKDNLFLLQLEIYVCSSDHDFYRLKKLCTQLKNGMKSGNKVTLLQQGRGKKKKRWSDNQAGCMQANS